MSKYISGEMERAGDNRRPSLPTRHGARRCRNVTKQTGMATHLTTIHHDMHILSKLYVDDKPLCMIPTPQAMQNDVQISQPYPMMLMQGT